eukprot:TRINITY_DN18526_c0_g1_i1.p1 TRINITY_DN18526_c0_g1~~TRINITY_DN18526_c0_g1_i1.p1  ORF type:complete len:137 (+),score=47.28 TRINITY_DN18526_c0_g1_i1:54-464(+)
MSDSSRLLTDQSAESRRLALGEKIKEIPEEGDEEAGCSAGCFKPKWKTFSVKAASLDGRFGEIFDLEYDDILRDLCNKVRKTLDYDAASNLQFSIGIKVFQADEMGSPLWKLGIGQDVEIMVRKLPAGPLGEVRIT